MQVLKNFSQIGFKFGHLKHILNEGQSEAECGAAEEATRCEQSAFNYFEFQRQLTKMTGGKATVGVENGIRI